MIAAYTEVKTGQLAIRLGRVASQMAVKRGGAAVEPIGPNGGRRCEAAVEQMRAASGWLQPLSFGKLVTATAKSRR
ncbi:hypothetical protein D3C71_1043830 [compost metagenome]